MIQLVIGTKIPITFHKNFLFVDKIDFGYRNKLRKNQIKIVWPKFADMYPNGHMIDILARD